MEAILLKNPEIGSAYSIRSLYARELFKYTVGETVACDNFDDRCANICSAGIHFFFERQKAVDYFNF
jgi:hypothetical protein